VVAFVKAKGLLMDRNTWISAGIAASVLAAFGLFWLVGEYAKGVFRESRLEVRFPEKTLSYGREEFRQLTASDVRKAYVVPLLFPLDLIVMLALAGSMGVAIWYWFGQLGPLWAMLALVPVIYFVSDLAEDCLLAWMLQPSNAWSVTIGTLKTLTAIKHSSVIASVVLTVAAFLLWVCRTLS